MTSSSNTLTIARRAYALRLDAACQRLVTTLSRVEGIARISIFGSYARGRRDLTTDLDVLVVWDTDKPFVDRLRALYGLAALDVDLDLVCYTPEEFEALQDSPFLRQVAREEVVLFATKPA